MRWSTPSVPASTPSTRLGHDEGSRVRHRYPPVRHRRMEARERGRVGTRVSATQASAAAGARRTGARARRRRRRGSRSARSRSTRRRTNRRTATRSWPAARRGEGGSGGPTSCSTRRRGVARRRPLVCRRGDGVRRAARRCRAAAGRDFARGGRAAEAPARAAAAARGVVGRVRERRGRRGSPDRWWWRVGAGVSVMCVCLGILFLQFTKSSRQSIEVASRRWRGGGRTNLGAS